MAMRYLFRRSKPEDLAALKNDLPGFEARLAKPAENLKRAFEIHYTPLRSALFQFQTIKTAKGDWAWACPSVEVVAENEAGLMEMAKKFNVPPPTHLKV